MPDVYNGMTASGRPAAPDRTAVPQPAVISTVVLRLHRPSRRKQMLLQQCFEHYAEGIQCVIDRLKPEIERLASQRLCPPLTALSRLMTPADLRGLKPLGLEPLADGLRMDLAMLLLNYLAHVRNGQPASLPVIRRSPDAWAAEAEDLIAAGTEGRLSRRRLRLQLERTLATVGRSKSIYFGRHAATRDFCLLYQPDTGRFFVKLHLMNRQAARAWSAAGPAVSEPQPTGQSGRRAPLFHMTDGHPPMAPARPGDRFIVLPLDMGRRQYQQLMQAWQDPAMIRTARLCRSKGEFDLHVQLRQRLPDTRQAKFLLGLVRSHTATAAYALCRPDGQPISEGDFDGSPQVVAAAICQMARQTAAQVIMPDLSRRDGRQRQDGLFRADPRDPAGEPFAAVCSRLQWQSLASLLDRQLPQAGLPRPIAVSPFHLYQTCPACHSRRKDNRLRDSLLVCTACGHSQDVARAGSLNVVRKFLRYQLQRQLPPGLDRAVP